MPNKTTVHKFAVFPGRNVLRLPPGASILSVGDQGGTIQVWVRLDPEAQAEDRVIQVFDTGWDIVEPDDTYLHFINTVQVGNFVFHVFEEVPWSEMAGDDVEF